MSKTVPVAHLGGCHVGYRVAGPIKQSKPTLILINSFTQSAELYKPQLSDGELADAMNVVAIEPLGHGGSKTTVTDTFTHWDSALATIQAMDALGIRKAFVAGTSQGGPIAARIALYAPDRVLGLIPIGSSMDSETERSRKLGCWDASALDGLIDGTASATETADFAPPEEFLDSIVTVNFAEDVDATLRSEMKEAIKKRYTGDIGRKRLRQSAINIRDRDSLHSRLPDIKCPVLWLQGDKDLAFSVANAQEEIKLFVNSPAANVEVVQGGQHLLGMSHTEIVNKALLAFVAKYSDKPDARKLREAVGMIDI